MQGRSCIGVHYRPDLPLNDGKKHEGEARQNLAEVSCISGAYGVAAISLPDTPAGG
jgi:hypothetical protein